jgi:hypothetical protein
MYIWNTYLLLRNDTTSVLAGCDHETITRPKENDPSSSVIAVPGISASLPENLSPVLCKRRGMLCHPMFTGSGDNTISSETSVNILSIDTTLHPLRCGRTSALPWYIWTSHTFPCRILQDKLLQKSNKFISCTVRLWNRVSLFERMTSTFKPRANAIV